jgi:hypothetical protein
MLPTIVLRIDIRNQLLRRLNSRFNACMPYRLKRYYQARHLHKSPGDSAATSSFLGSPLRATMLTSTLTMLSAFWLLLATPHVLARQIPVVEGVIGGVPSMPRFHEVDATVVPAATTPGKLRVVENSGVCETTPGVYQASGYGDLTSSESLWSVCKFD